MQPLSVSAFPSGFSSLCTCSSRADRPLHAVSLSKGWHDGIMLYGMLLPLLSILLVAAFGWYPHGEVILVFCSALPKTRTRTVVCGCYMRNWTFISQRSSDFGGICRLCNNLTAAASGFISFDSFHTVFAGQNKHFPTAGPSARKLDEKTEQLKRVLHFHLSFWSTNVVRLPPNQSFVLWIIAFSAFFRQDGFKRSQNGYYASSQCKRLEARRPCTGITAIFPGRRLYMLSKQVLLLFLSSFIHFSWLTSPKGSSQSSSLGGRSPTTRFWVRWKRFYR